MPSRVTRDPDHPDFPHGEPKGYLRGCHKDCCRVPRNKYLREAELRRFRLRKQLGDDTAHSRSLNAAEVAQLREHVDHLFTAAPGATIGTVAGLIGSPASTLSGWPGCADSLSRGVAQKVLALTAPQVAAARLRVPRAEAVHLIRTRQALGYSMTWQTTQVGTHMSGLIQKELENPGGLMFASVYEKLAAFAARLTEPATPENTGLPQSAITTARKQARAAGYYPPACYDEDGNLDPAAIPGHPITVANDAADEALTKALTYLKALDMFGGATDRAADYLATTKSTRGRSTQVASIARNLDRFVKHHLIRVSDPDSVARRRHMAQVITDYSHGGVGSPVAVALALGMQDWTMRNTRVVSMLTPDPKGKGRSSNGVTRPPEPHPGLAEADELAHLHPLVAVPMPDTEGVAA